MISLGLWALRQGLNKTYPRSARSSKVFIGPVSKPIMFVKRYQVKYFLDEWFDSAYQIWWRFHLGMGMPNSIVWGNESAHVANIIEAFESEHRAMNRPGG